MTKEKSQKHLNKWVLLGCSSIRTLVAMVFDSYQVRRVLITKNQKIYITGKLSGHNLSTSNAHVKVDLCMTLLKYEYYKWVVTS